MVIAKDHDGNNEKKNNYSVKFLMVMACLQIVSLLAAAPQQLFNE